MDMKAFLSLSHVLASPEGEGYGLSAILDVDLKAFDRAKTIEMVKQAHKICPYSVGTRGNMEVELKVQGESIPVEASENAGVAEKGGVQDGQNG